MIASVEVAPASAPDIAPGSPTVAVSAVVKSKNPGAFAVFVAEGKDETAVARAARRPPRTRLRQPRGHRFRPRGRRPGGRERSQPADRRGSRARDPRKRRRVVMSHGRRDEDIVRTTHNTARFFTETRHVSWVMLIFTLVWGFFGYFSMPQRKDPDIAIRAAAGLDRLARSERGEDRAARHAPRRGDDRRAIRRSTRSRRTPAPAPLSCHHRTAEERRRPRQAVRRHQAEAGRRSTDLPRGSVAQLHQGLRRHGDAAPDRGQPAR